ACAHGEQHPENCKACERRHCQLLLARPGRKRRPGDGVVSCLVNGFLVNGFLVSAFLVTGFPSSCHFVTSSAAGAVESDRAGGRPTGRLLMWRDLWAKV